MPRGPSPVVPQDADVLAIDAHAAHVAAIAFMRSRPASLLLLPAPSPTRLSLLLSLSVLRQHLPCCTHGMLQTPVSRAHTHA